MGMNVAGIIAVVVVVVDLTYFITVAFVFKAKLVAIVTNPTPES